VKPQSPEDTEETMHAFCPTTLAKMKLGEALLLQLLWAKMNFTRKTARIENLARLFHPRPLSLLTC
jgi:hypothetical protein